MKKEKMKLKIKRLTESAKLPTKGYSSDAAYDVYCDKGFVLEGYEPTNNTYAEICTKTVSTGIALGIPEGYYIRVEEKSGLASKGIKVSAGIIDNSYIGELKVIMVNTARGNIVFEGGQKIAQIILTKMEHCDIIEVDELEDTDRGDAGFGSTGS